tara:strand:+ start:1961 stop:2215 length:255 start_codon:yes stop_codon:yes gene_type:complete
MITLYLKTKQGTMIEIGTCQDDENEIRKIVQGYEDIWQSIINRPIDTPAEEYASSIDPIILNWGGSEILVENPEADYRYNHFNL